jgi:capsular polysaccharide biosynthesis protein
MEATQTVKENEVSLALVIKAIRKFWLLMLIVTVVFAAVGAAYTYFLKADYYKASSSFWVKGNNISSNALMAANYAELIDTDSLLRRAVSNKDGISSGLPLNEQWNCSVDDAVRTLRSVLSSTKSSEETCIFTITATSTNRKVAYQAIDAVQYALSGYIAQELDPDGNFPIQILNQVHSIEDVTVVKRPFMKNTVIFGVIGAFISFAVCVVTVIYRPEILAVKRKKKITMKNTENKDE